MYRKVKVKICCISSIEEANLAIKYGASALGLVSDMPSGPGVISEELIAEIAAEVPPHINTFLLTSKRDADSIVAQQRKCKTNTLQIVDGVRYDVYEKLRKKLPGISIVQVIHVSDEKSIVEARQVSEYVDALLLDSGNQNLAVKELGGTGRTHNWKLSKEIVENVNVRVYLAGGINASNVIAAIQVVNPFGVDLCSGVRRAGRLNEELLKEFFRKIESL